MKVLVVGGGGREHAIIKELVKSDKVDTVICAPGNGGIADIAECFDVKAADIDGQCRLAVEQKADYVVVAPDDPLALGLVDRLEALGIPAFGPRANAAALEASKVFSKSLMKRYNIPTARYEVFSEPDEAIGYIRRTGAPLVVKADGLALGKGVYMCRTAEEGEDAVISLMKDAVFGASGRSVVIEEWLEGPEVTVLCFSDGDTLAEMPSSQDHKRAYDGDEGPNTGGMGAFSPSPHYTGEIAARCKREIFTPTLNALKSEGIEYKGVIYFGLMLTKDGPKVIEYNARFGDPETQCILPRLKSDLFEIFLATTYGGLDKLKIEWDGRPACCIVLASGGYPGKYSTGYVIEGLEESGGSVYHAGTKKEDGRYVTSGGRVLGITALGDGLKAARDLAYSYVKPISFKDMHYRRDIGKGF
ncbi:MAG: phosphoribosylamine--glycine ligase [Oscillospiraceae bacterium]|nr:phosphoribosylamine--glycine ligase [Oscillospiraceae bacterium]